MPRESKSGNKGHHRVGEKGSNFRPTWSYIMSDNSPKQEGGCNGAGGIGNSHARRVWETLVFTQRGWNPLHSVRFFRGTISVQSILINNHDNGDMGKHHLPALYPHPVQ